MSYDQLTRELHKEPEDTGGNDTGDQGSVSGASMGSVNPEEEKQRHLLLTKVRTYLTAFPEKCAEFNDPERYPLEDMTKEDLELTLEKIKINLGSRNAIGFWKGSAVQLVGIAEHGLCWFTPLKLQGLTAALKDDPEWNDCLTELALEYGGLSHMPAWARFAMISGKTALMVHSANTAISRAAAQGILMGPPSAPAPVPATLSHPKPASPGGARLHVAPPTEPAPTDRRSVDVQSIADRYRDL